MNTSLQNYLLFLVVLSSPLHFSLLQQFQLPLHRFLDLPLSIVQQICSFLLLSLSFHLPFVLDVLATAIFWISLIHLFFCSCCIPYMSSLFLLTQPSSVFFPFRIIFKIFLSHMNRFSLVQILLPSMAVDLKIILHSLLCGVFYTIYVVLCTAYYILCPFLVLN